MKRPQLCVAMLVVGFMLSCCIDVFACTYNGLPDSLKRGINISHSLEKLDTTLPTPTQLAQLRDTGLTAIRLPVNGSLLMSHFTDVTTRNAMWNKLDTALQVITGSGFVVMLDMHPDARFANLHQENPSQALSLLKTLWIEINTRYIHYPTTVLFYELLNEPVIVSSLWRAQAQELIYTLRPHAPNRWFIVGSGDAQRIDALVHWQPLDDIKIIYAVHFYDPMVFTHQGLTWDSTDPLRLLSGVPFPVDLQNPAMVSLLNNLDSTGEQDYANQFRQELVVPWGESNIIGSFNMLAQWQNLHAKPVLVNEFGVLRYHAPTIDRIRWLGFVAGEAKRICAGWTLWDYNQGFGIVDSDGNLETAVIDALFPQ